MVHNRHKHLGSQADCCLRQPGLRSSSSPTFLNKLARDKQKSCNQETVLLLWAIPDLFQCFLPQSGQQTISSRTDWSGLVQKTRAIVSDWSTSNSHQFISSGCEWRTVWNSWCIFCSLAKRAYNWHKRLLEKERQAVWCCLKSNRFQCMWQLPGIKVSRD